MAEHLPLFTFDTPAEDDNLESQPIRQMLNALGDTFRTTNINYPLAPRAEMLRVLDEDDLHVNIRLQRYYGGVWVTLLAYLKQALPIPRRLESAIIVAAGVWTINHNLGVRPLVQCFDAADTSLIPVSVVHVLVAGVYNRVVITLGAPSAGYAIFVG